MYMMNQELEKLLSALQAEHDYAKKEHTRIENLPFPERVSLGFAFPPLPLKSIDEQRILLRIPKNTHIHDGIEPGDTVSLFPRSAEELAVEGLCADIDSHSVEIRSKEAVQAPWIQKGDICVQKRFDERSYLLQENGLQKAIAHESSLKNALLGDWTLEIAMDAPNRSLLNTDQSIAIETFLRANSLSLIHGPPGTGKTHTIAVLCAELISSKQRLWVLADSNAATDNLCQAIAALNIDVLRLGSSFRISAKTWHLSLQHRQETHPHALALKKLEKQIRTSSGKEKGLLVKEKKHIERSMRSEIVENAHIIVSTLGTMHKEAPHLPSPALAIIDEASQVIDPSIWTLVPYIPKLLLVGDPHQLGPVVLSQHPRLQQTLLKTKMNMQKAPMLTVQHRMHQCIHRLVQTVYGETYIPHPSVANRTLCDDNTITPNSLTKTQVLWIDTTGAEEGEERDSITHSLYNPTEIDWVCQAYHALKHSQVQNIGIVTPYSAQVQRLREELPDAEVNTVTSFQGAERDVIICSFVRSNWEGELGFVADPERLTVSLTRAKKLLIAIGDTSLLSQNQRFAELFSLLEEEQQIISIWDENPFVH